MNAAHADFDLLNERWIPALTRGGELGQVSLIECLERAHELREIFDPSPLVVFGIHRLLAAVLHSYLPIADEDKWVEHWDQGRFEPSFLERVQERCTGRLKLFDPARPFYQSGDIPLIGVANKDLKTVGYLFLEESTGTNVVHFSHHGDDQHAYCPVCCAKGLLAQPPFATSGGAGIKPSINGVPPIYVLPGAGSLFATLLLNYILAEFRPRTASENDPGPLWEGDGVIPAKDERVSVGFVESLTWPPRRIRLLPAGSGHCSRCGREDQTVVRRMVYVMGRSRADGLPIWDDPWAAYLLIAQKKTGDQVEPVPLRPREEQDVWRDFPTLFLSQKGAVESSGSGQRWQRPSVLEQLGTLLHEGCVPPDLPLRYDTFALRTDMKAKVFEWRQNLFDFPPALLPNSKATGGVQRALGLAGAVNGHLAGSLKKLHPISERSRPDKQALGAAMNTLVRHSSLAYWQALELPFRRLITDKRLRDSAEQRRGWLEEWSQIVCVSATDILEGALENFDADADGLRRQVKARDNFYRELKREVEKKLKMEVIDGNSQQ